MAMTISERSNDALSLLNPIAAVRNLWRHRNLIQQFTRRDIEGRYKGSFLGIIWALVNPLVLLLIYTYVFGVVFRSRWPNTSTDNLAEFALILFAGLSLYNIVSEVLNRATTIVISVPNYVTKVVFPLEILPVSLMGTALFHGAMSLVILLIGNLLIVGRIVWTLPLLPLVLLPLVLLALGCGWFLSSLGVFLRDINYLITLLLQIVLFLTPIFYPIEIVPEPLRLLLWLNPLTSIVENYRRVVLWQQLPEWWNLGLWSTLGLCIAVLGYAWFVKSKKAFADVL